MVIKEGGGSGWWCGVQTIYKDGEARVCQAVGEFCQSSAASGTLGAPRVARTTRWLRLL